MVTHERLKGLLCYNPRTGLFLWLVNRGRAMAGTLAGTVRPDGRVQIILEGKAYLAHRLAWLYMYGVWPNEEIDHINRNPMDNRISNLRVVNRSENQQNVGHKATSKTKIRGVSLHKHTGKWLAQIYHNGVKYHLGVFDLVEDAAKARKEAEERYHHSKVYGDKRIMEEASVKT